MITLIAGYTAYLRDLDWYWIALIVLGVLGVFTFILRSVYWYIDRNKIMSDETTAPLIADITKQSKTDLQENSGENKDEAIAALKIEHQAEIESLKEKHEKELNKQKELYQRLQTENKDEKEFYENQHKAIKQQLETNYQNELETLKNEHKKEIFAWRTHEKNMQSVADDFESTLMQYSWLIELAKKQRQRIDDYVILERFYFCRIATDTIPTAIFVAEIRNYSLFDVELENTIGGHIEFDNLELGGRMRFNPNSSLKIASTLSNRITIEVRISNEEKAFIDGFCEKHKIPIEQGFIISGLILTIKGSDNAWQVKPKQLKIRNSLKVINSDEYTKALEKFG